MTVPGQTPPENAFFIPFPGKHSATPFAQDDEDPHVVVVIPARFASTRFPGKPLCEIKGRPMIEWIARKASQSDFVDQVIIATDDKRIQDAMESRGYDVRITSGGARTGTDRMAEVASQIKGDIFVNLQADEILSDSRILDQVVEPLLKDPRVPIATVRRRLLDPSDISNQNIVKVVCNQAKYALYFSRSVIPADRDQISSKRPDLSWDQHLGVYAYRRDVLLEFARLPTSPLEELEKLEQLRALDYGFSIFVARTEYESYRIDVPSDLDLLPGNDAAWI
jgi:3-deoxy-manno-octulosonate cytidylyltransferase (CMP-KDO synthetase)